MQIRLTISRRITYGRCEGTLVTGTSEWKCHGVALPAFQVMILEAFDFIQCMQM
jgi:hypothetical protein